MPLRIRHMSPDDARAFLEVHRAAVRTTAARHYPFEVTEAWAPLPVTEAAIESVQMNRGNEYRLIAEIDDRIVGVGSLVIENSELRACYVSPEAGRQAVGSALVREMERVARERGLAFLELDSSITAEPFYTKLGYEVRERGQHLLGSGQPMASVNMRMELGSRPS
jgi:putative acetyltransferase